MTNNEKYSGIHKIETIDKAELFRHAFEGANDGVCIVTLDGRLLKVNQRMCDIFGYSVEELEGTPVKDITLQEDQEISPEFIRKSICGDITSDVFEKRYIHKNGQIIHGQVSISLIRNNDRKPAYYISHVQDVTKRKEAEEESERLIIELRKALSEIKMLRGILPLCSFCKKIRDDKGYWEQVDVYIYKHSEADISHSICPECMKKEYPNYQISEKINNVE